MITSGKSALNAHIYTRCPKPKAKQKNYETRQRIGPNRPTREPIRWIRKSHDVRKCLLVVNIAFGVHLAEKIMKIVNRLVRIGRPERRFGGFGNRMMLEIVCLWSTSHSVSIWLKNYENLQQIGPNRPT